MNAVENFAARFATPWVYWIALLGLCAAYLQGGIVKATDFSGAIAENEHFGLTPAAPLAIAVIALELGASVMILAGIYRWLGALALSLSAFGNYPRATSGSWLRMLSLSISGWLAVFCLSHGMTSRRARR